MKPAEVRAGTFAGWLRCALKDVLSYTIQGGTLRNNGGFFALCSLEKAWVTRGTKFIFIFPNRLKGITMAHINLVLMVLAIVATLIAPFLPGWVQWLRSRNLP